MEINKRQFSKNVLYTMGCYVYTNYAESYMHIHKKKIYITVKPVHAFTSLTD